MNKVLDIYQQTAFLTKIGIWEINWLTKEVFWDNVSRYLFELEEHTSVSFNSFFQYLADEEDAAQLKQSFENISRNGEHYSCSFLINTAKQTTKWIEVSAQCIFKYGKCIQLLGIFKDVTETIQIQQQQQILDYKLNTLFNNAPIGIGIIDELLRWSEVNQLFCQQTGYANTELISKPFYQMLHADDWGKCYEQLISLQNNGIDKLEEEVRLIHQSGKVLWSQLLVTKMNASKGVKDVYIAQINNITSEKQSANLLAFANKKFKAATESAGVGVWEYDIRLKEMSWDDAMYTLFESTPTDTKNILSIWQSKVHTTDLPTVTKLFQEAILQKNDIDINFKIVSKNGLLKYIQAKGKVIYNNNNMPEKIVGISFDITNKVTLEQTVAKSDELQKLILQVSLSFINAPLQNLDALINQALQTIGEYSNSDRAYIFSYDTTNNTMNNTYEWCAQNVSPEIINLQQIPFDAVPDWVATHMQGNILHVPLVDNLEEGNLKEILQAQNIKTLITIPLLQNKNCFGFIGFDAVKKQRIWSETEIVLLQLLAELLSNVEQRKKTQDQLLIESKRLAGIIEATNVGTWEWNIVTGETVYNERWAQMIGYELAELAPLHKTIWRELVHPDDEALSDAALQECFNKKTPFYECQFRLKHKNGSWVWIKDKGKVIKWTDEGKPHIMMGTHTDITQRIKNEEKLHKTLQIVSEQNKKLLNFAHIISHNLRSHIGNFDTLLQLLASETNEAEKNHIIELLHANTANLEESIQNLNKVVQIQTNGKQALKQLNLLTEIEKIVEEQQMQLDENAATFHLNINAGIEINYNQSYLHNIVSNLISNAIKFKHPERKPIIKIYIEKLDNEIHICVKDNGLGINLSLHQHKIFGMYKTFHQHKEARGLGLFISNNQAEAMGGKIDVTSEEGIGSIFKLIVKNLY